MQVERSHFFLRVPVQIQKADDARCRVRGKQGSQSFKIAHVVVERIAAAEKNRIVAPDHPFPADHSGQPPKGRNDDLPFGRNARLRIFSVGIERELKIKRTPFQQRKPVQHGQRILRPEYEAVRHFRGKPHPAHPARIHGIAYKNKALLHTTEKPVRIEGRYVRSPACAYDHASLRASLPDITPCSFPELSGTLPR